MAVLIIGSGLIGSQIARIEVERGERPVIFELTPQPDALGELVDLSKVTIVQGNVLSPLELAGVIRSEGITHIMHTAANALLTDGAQRNPYPAVELNIMGTLNVLEAARLFGVQRVVISSSAVLYSSMSPALEPDSPDKEEALPRTGTFYATTKQTVENLALNYVSTFNMDVRAVRYAAVFGPWRGRGGGGGATQAIREMVEHVLREEAAGFPEFPQRIEFIYSKDAALGTVLACHAEGVQSRVFNIGMGMAVSSQEIIDTLKQMIPGARVNLIGGRGLASPQAGGSGGVYAARRSSSMDQTRSSTEIKYRPAYDMRAALEDYITFYRGRSAG